MDGTPSNGLVNAVYDCGEGIFNKDVVRGVSEILY